MVIASQLRAPLGAASRPKNITRCRFSSKKYCLLSTHTLRFDGSSYNRGSQAMKFVSVSLCRAALVGGAAIIATGMLAGSARAISFTLPTTPCAACGGSVSANADVTLGTNSLTVVLTNTAADPASLSLGQLLSGFDITFGTTIGSPSGLTQTGQLIDVSAGPTPPLGT